MADLGNLLGAIIDIRTSKRTKEAEKAISELDKKIDEIKSKKIDLRFSENYQKHLSELKRAKKALSNIYREDYSSADKYKQAKREARQEVSRKQLSVDRSKRWYEKYNKSVQEDVNTLVSHQKAVKDDEKQNKSNSRAFKELIGRFNLGFKVAIDALDSFKKGIDEFLGKTGADITAGIASGVSTEDMRRNALAMQKYIGKKYGNTQQLMMSLVPLMNKLGRFQDAPSIAREIALATGKGASLDWRNPQQSLENTVNQLIQARRSGRLDWRQAPSIPLPLREYVEQEARKGGTFTATRAGMSGGATEESLYGAQSVRNFGGIPEGWRNLTGEAGRAFLSPFGRNPDMTSGLYSSISTQGGNNVGTIEVNYYGAQAYDITPPSASNPNIINSAVNGGR